MTFASSNLSVLAYANTFTLWHYITADTSVETSNYFDKAANMLRVNDLIITTIDSDDTPETKFYIVTGNDGSAVTVSLFSAPAPE
ncbi:MAG: hypothetical protein CMH30_06740 [Micavibrio sp.]|nr:hypothetical protein [Micavibrio sp.]|tara:strand:- start:1230 stop:1484 length:255 start_codon:yes stop_codon:yes gene_type:complete